MKNPALRLLSMALGLALIMGKALFPQDAKTFKAEPLEHYISQYMDWYDLPGLAIGLVKDGETIYKRGFGVKCLKSHENVTANTIFSTASVTKLFVGLAVMQLYEENRIGLDEPISKYLPYFELDDGLHNTITIAQLLNHTSGLDDEGEDLFSSWENPEFDDGALKRFVKGLKTKSVVSKPGEKYLYSNIGYEILGCLISEISGVSLEEYVNKNILEPIGMHQSNMLLAKIERSLLACPNVLDTKLEFGQTKYFPYTRRHAASGTLLSNVEDMCRFALTVLNKGEIDGNRVLKESSLAKMLTPVNDNPAGLSFHVDKTDSVTFIYHAGGDPGFRTEFILIPEKRLGVVVMTNQWEHQIEPLAYKALNCLMGEDETDWFTFYHGSLWEIIRKNDAENAVKEIRGLFSKNGLGNFHPAILNQHGNLLQDLGRAKEAIEYKKLNIEYYPKIFQLYNSLAESYAGLGDADNAIMYYRKSIEIRPKNNIANDRLRALTAKR